MADSLFPQLFTDPAAAGQAAAMDPAVIAQLKRILTGIAAVGGGGPAGLMAAQSAFRSPVMPPTTPNTPVNPSAVPQVNPLAMPRVPLTNRTVPDASTLSLPLPPGSELPPPLILPAPPTIGGPAKPNFSKLDEFIAQSKPTPSAHLNSVLGGLAAGAGSVPSTEAGSFARALAQAGAGGTQGFATSAKSFTDYAKNAASTELDKSKLIQDQQNHAASIAAQNVRLQYEVIMKNAEAKQQYLTQQRQELMPVVKSDANGITIQQMDPESKKINVQYKPTKPLLDNAEKIAGIIKATGGSGPVADTYETNLIVQSAANSPEQLPVLMKQLALRQVMRNNAGPAVFGPAYEAAYKIVDKQLSTEAGNMKVQKPLEYNLLLQERIQAELMRQPWFNRTDWIPVAAPHSIAAQTMMPMQQAVQTAPAPVTPKPAPQLLPLRQPGEIEQ